jgi:hypothetical protein
VGDAALEGHHFFGGNGNAVQGTDNLASAAEVGIKSAGPGKSFFDHKLGRKIQLAQ